MLNGISADFIRQIKIVFYNKPYSLVCEYIKQAPGIVQVDYDAYDVAHTLFYQAVIDGCIDIVRMALETGTSPNLTYSDNHETPLHLVARTPRIDMMALFSR